MKTTNNISKQPRYYKSVWTFVEIYFFFENSSLSFVKIVSLLGTCRVLLERIVAGLNSLGAYLL